MLIRELNWDQLAQNICMIGILHFHRETGNFGATVQILVQDKTVNSDLSVNYI
jgi:hypothetical protein